MCVCGCVCVCGCGCMCVSVDVCVDAAGYDSINDHICDSIVILLLITGINKI